MSDLPQYQSHKRVGALQIERLETIDDTVMIHFTDPDFAAVEAEPDMFVRYTPVPGDYYIAYPDGYKSISPKAAFEEGYSLVRTVVIPPLADRR